MSAPSRRDAAWRLQAAHPQGFWCSSSAGGCGQVLGLTAGEVRAPYFRHGRGQIRDCLSFRDEHALERGYLHLAIQLQLHRWLIEQGYEVTLEHRFTDASRADVHVTGPGHAAGPEHAAGPAHAAGPEHRAGLAHERNATAGTRDASPAAEDVHIRWVVSDPGAGFDLTLGLEGHTGSSSDPVSPGLEEPGASRTGSQTLEVQLSAISYQDLLRRDARYRRHTEQVTWLFGERARALAGIQREERGVSFGLWPRPRSGIQDTAGHPASHGAVDGVVDGVASGDAACDVDEQEITSPRGAQRAAAADESVGGAPDDGELGEVEVWIGTCRPGDLTDWVPLYQCALRADGLWTPTRDNARAETSRHSSVSASRPPSLSGDADTGYVSNNCTKISRISTSVTRAEHPLVRGPTPAARRADLTTPCDPHGRARRSTRRAS